MNRLKTFFLAMRKENLKNKFLIVLNIFSYSILRIAFRLKKTEKILLKTVPFRTSLRWFKIIYYFDLLTFLNNFETDKYLDVILDKKYWVIIDIWSNIWRISWISAIHSKNIDKTFILCDPNPSVFALSRNFYEKVLKLDKKIYFINNAISNKSSKIPFYVIKWDELDWLWSLHKENIKKLKTKEIVVEGITFSDLIQKFPSIKVSKKNILIKIDVEWHEKHVFQSIISFLNKIDAFSLDILVEIWDENVENILKTLKETWFLNKFEKISYNDYFVVLEK